MLRIRGGILRAVEKHFNLIITPVYTHEQGGRSTKMQICFIN